MKAEITAFLSMVFILLVSFTGSMIESTSIQNMKNFRRTDGERAMECLFAEYQKELLEKYDVFSMDAGYETGTYQKELLDRRLEFYELENFRSSIERIQFLSDNKGKAFYEQAVNHMKHRYGLDFVEKELEMTDSWVKNEEILDDYQKEEEQNKDSIDRLLQENEMKLPAENNPMEQVKVLKKSPVLSLVIPKGMTVSEKKISLEELPSHRKLNKGYGDFSEEGRENQTLEKLLFGKYLIEHFQSASEDDGNVMNYELEYLLAGKSNDRENLQFVVNRLLIFRFASNYTYLQTSSTKKAEAHTLALTLSSLLAVPAITEATAQGILFSWAFGESVMDIRALLNGSKVPFTKDDRSWQLSLSGLLKLGETGEASDGSNLKDGHSYEDYLRILLFLGNQEEITMRVLDLIEQNLQKIQGLPFFRTDCCITKLDLKIRCELRRGISYTFPLYFGYL